MRILYFHQYFSTPKGSAGTRSFEMAKHLVEKGHEVTMVYTLMDMSGSVLDGAYKNGVRKGQYMGINLIEFNLQYSNRMNFVQRALVFLRYSAKSTFLVFTEKYDLIFATSTPLTAGIPGIVAKIFRPQKKFVFEVRDLWPELPKAMGVIKNPIVLQLMSWLEYFSYKAADACVGLSPGIVKGINSRLKKIKAVELIPNSCDLELFKPGKESKSIFPGLDNFHFVATFTGAHGFANGLEAALDAADYLKTTPYFEKIKLVFIGDGIRKDDLMRSAEERGLSNCIFLNPVPKEKLIQYMHASDVGLMLLANVPAFYYGTSPNKFFDYISSGLPVLNNYPGWVKDMIQTNECGVAVPPGDSQKFGEALIGLYKNKEQRFQMGQNARNLAERDFDRQVLAGKLHKLFQEVNYG
ncbi:glycosyltransferase family 4 protein [Cecembia lonarensis]|uniref:Putative glycosyl transferase n=1 Tax=Cecembia lonarensis (strain CCUG 58316 / KCTC 22772 / LW9) TaxID=1225176 RepID=K1L8U3_CECL9|nr:glycosyltransferase family 4 protein [Cecembia lonarensis]EKB48602.1 putative glycosyl transferase [Cecembia lonarensis LW9]